MPETPEYAPMTGDVVKSTMGPRNRGPAPQAGTTAPAPPKKVVGHGYFGNDPHAVSAPAAKPTPTIAGAVKNPATSIASTVAMTKGSMVGFVDEMTKEAGLRDVLHRIFSGGGKSAGKKLGFFERRRIARSLGIKPHQVEMTLERRKRIGQVARGGATVGAAAVGSLAGSRISHRENADE